MADSNTMQVLVVAHGPQPTTRKAVARVRSWGRIVSSITVVPASQRGLPARAIPGAAVSAAIGSAALRREALAAGSEPVLVIHDDVTLTAAGARILLRELPTATFVVPYSNERGLDTTIAALPPAARAAGVLDRRAHTLTRRSVTAARHACLIGRGIDVAAITGTIVMPGSTSHRLPGVIVAAPCAAAHDRTCDYRLVTDALDPDQPLLVASMIVRDEEDALPAALESITGLVDRIEICDTGSVDSTLDVISRYGAHTTEIPWRDDFAWARNQALDSCRDAQFALMFDADERVQIADAGRFRRWLRTWAHEIDAILVDVESDRGEGATTTSTSCRIARAAGASFAGAIHEALTVLAADGSTPATQVLHPDLRVRHVGYRPEILAAKTKASRNIDIARTAHSLDPSLKSKVDLARALRSLDEADSEADALFRDALQMLGPEHLPSAHSLIESTIAASELADGRPETAIELALSALDHTPNEDVALVTVANALVTLGRHDELVSLHETLGGRPQGDPMFSVSRNVSRYRAYVGLAMMRCGRHDDAQHMLVGVLRKDAGGAADLVAAAVPDAIGAVLDPEWLVPLLVADATGQVLDTITGVVAPIVTARLCAAALERGARHPSVFSILVTASLVAGDIELARSALAHRDVAEPSVLPKLADLAHRKGHAAFAAELASGATATHRLVTSGGRT